MIRSLANRIFQPRLPVLVWIHGGAYLHGAGSDYRAEQLVRASNRSVVVVTVDTAIFFRLW